MCPEVDTSANVVSAPDPSKPAAIIFTHSLLEGSCTFIKSHAEALTKHTAVYAGAHRVPGLELPADRTHVINDGSHLGLAREAVFRSIGWAPGFVRRLRVHRPRIVHAHFGTSGPAAMSLARALEVPLLVTFHGQDATAVGKNRPSTHRERELQRHKKRLISEAGAFIAVSEYIRQRLLEQGYPDSKIILHRNGIDLDYFCPASNLERDPIIVFVGRFVEKKGGEYLIDAARQLHESGVQLELVMIGGGPLEASLKARATQSGIPCRFTGFLPVSEVKRWLNRASVVAIPSVVASDGDSEGLPTIQLEAQAMGAPVVATRHSGIPEGVIEGVTAELVDERDTKALAIALRSFLESRNKVKEFGEAGRRFVAERFELRAQVRGLEDIYECLRPR